MTGIFNSIVPLRMKVLKMTELLLVLSILPLAHKVFAGEAMTQMSGMDARAGLLGLLVLVCLYLVDFYQPALTLDRAQSLSRILQATGLALLVVSPLFETEARLLKDPDWVLVGMSIVGAGLTTLRFLFAQLVLGPVEPTVVWGSGPLAANIIGELRHRPDLGIRVVGVVDSSFSGEAFAGVRYLGAPDLVWSLGGSGQVTRLILALDERRSSFPLERLMTAQASGLKVENGTELYEELTGKVWLDTFGMADLLFSRKLRPSAVGRFFQRMFSLLIAAIALLLCLPVLLITAILIRCESSGPAIFRQTRIGKNGQPFTMFKFRSMKEGSVGCAPAVENDPRYTRLGKWIRRFRIDELPQLINVLKGDMQLVGPRPFVPEQEASLVREIPGYRQRWLVHPGATGWAQVHRGYCSSLEDNIEKLSYDLFYIKHVSLAVDIRVLVETFRVVLLGKGGR